MLKSLLPFLLSSFCLSAFCHGSGIKQVSELNHIEHVIAEYYQYKAACPNIANIKTESIQMVLNGTINTLEISERLILTDLEYKVRIDVCGIKAHNYVWVRKMKTWYKIMFLVPVSTLDNDKKYFLPH